MVERFGKANVVYFVRFRPPLLIIKSSLDASGGSVFRNLLGAAEGALIRAAASTQPLGLYFTKVYLKITIEIVFQFRMLW